jgi:hypothetical protein
MRLDDQLWHQFVATQLDEINTKNQTTNRLAKPVHINGVVFDGSQDITVSGTSSGSMSIGGFPINVTQANDGDMLIFNGTTSAWVDIPKTDILDGGNF